MRLRVHFVPNSNLSIITVFIIFNATYIQTAKTHFFTYFSYSYMLKFILLILPLQVDFINSKKVSSHFLIKYHAN